MLSFTLPDEFIEQYANTPVSWGYTDAGGNSLGEITFLRTYSRLKPDGSKERWHEVCRRVIEGMYSIQKDHCKDNRLPWNDHKAQRSARDAYDRMFHFKWTPPGRGLWMMGTPLVNEMRNSAPLQNCCFISTADMTKPDPAEPFCFLMEASMLGVGVGFDDKGADKDFILHEPDRTKTWQYVIPDSREGWVESVKLLLESYLLPGRGQLAFNYDTIRPAGEPIKTFGGIAAGPEPLRKLHHMIRTVFNGRAGQMLTRTDIADVGNLIGVCVVSGNIRRSAELLIGHIDDKDFIRLKDPSVFPERNHWSADPNDQRDPGWGWTSNNSVEAKVGDDYAHLTDSIALNGEPGIVWMDVTRAYGRLLDPPNNRDHRAAGYNPSLAPGVRVYTTDGIVPIETLDGRAFKVKNLNGELSAAFCWQSGFNTPVYRVTFNGGWSYKATEQHKWPVWNPDTNRWEKKTTHELSPGDRLPNLQQLSVFPAGMDGTYDEGFLIGWNLGDGWQTDRKDGRRQYGFMVSEKDRQHGVAERLERSLALVGVRTSFDGKDEVNVSAPGICELFDRYGVGHKRSGLPSAVWKASVSDEFRRGVLDGLFSSDVSATETDGSVSFAQASETMVDDVASLLGFFGIKSCKQRVTRPRSEAFPGKYESDGSTFTRFVLRIGGTDNVRHFSRIVTLTRADKQAAIEAIATRRGRNNSWYIEVQSVAPDGRSDVWDVTVDDATHAFQIDHCITGNCAEQPLESGEMCTLVETYLGRHDSLEDFQRTIKFAYLYAKTVTLLPTHWPRTNAIMGRNRRIGCGISGVADFADSRGMAVLRRWLDEGYATVRAYDETYSEWLCVRESIKVTTVKPSGTVSILAGQSPGVHWAPGGEFFDRAVRFSKDDPMVPLFGAAGYRVEADVKNADTTVVVYFPVHAQARRSEGGVSLFEKVNLAVVAQRYWSDNSVSVTLSFDPATEAQHIPTVLHMHEGHLKTVSFLPKGNAVYPQQPYTQISPDEYDQATTRLFKVDLSPIYDGLGVEPIGERYCTTDTCLLNEAPKPVEAKP